MSNEPSGGPRRARRKHWLWFIPLAVGLLVVLAVAMLPKFVASGYHRATIEALASSLTGRNVQIGGKLSLGLLPNPQFIAGDITITSPDKETITASSLTLDIAPIPLLRGRISARSITLQSPHIALPWPLPGGAASIAPPRWLTALHAQISNGVVSLGAVTFTHVSADIFTGADGAFSVSGAGSIAGHPIDLALEFGAVSAVGSTPLTLDVHANGATKLKAHIAGLYDSSSSFSGSANFSTGSLAAFDPSLAAPLTGDADITADADEIAFNDLNLWQGRATLSGSATLRLTRPLLTLLLSGQDLDVPVRPAAFGTLGPLFAVLPVQLSLDAANTVFTGLGGTIPTPHLQCSAAFGAQGVTLKSLEAGLPGNSRVSLAGTLDTSGQLHARFTFDSAAVSTLLSGTSADSALPASLQEASLAGDVSGNADALAFSALTGNVGSSRITGTAILTQRRKLTGALHFDQLDLTPYAAMLQNPPDGLRAHALSADFEISVDHASIGKIPLDHLLVDAALGNQLTVRRFTARLWGGIAAASFTLSPNPDQGAAQSGPQAEFISSARIVLALPSATPIAALLPTALALPASLAKAPLAVSFLAAGPAGALATSATLTLGPISITAAPTIDLVHHTANGAFTLRHPDAIAAFKAFGLDAGLAWPGAGSIALRADMLLTPAQIGFSDFVLSMGDLTGNGSLIYSQDHHLNGEIDADTLALPPIPAGFIPPWSALAAIQGKIAISANRVLWGGNQILGPVRGVLAAQNSNLNLDITQASLAGGSLAGGTLTGELSATAPADLPPTKPALPAMTAKLSLSGADAATLGLPFTFPLTLAGRIDAAIDLTARGYAAPAWLATLSGTASLAGQSGTLNGFDLAGIATALTAKSHRLSLLRSASTSGTTPFTQLSVTGNFNNGIYTLATGALQGPAGSASASGNIDLPDAGLGLDITLLPKLPASPQLGLTIAGSWTTPRKTADLKKSATRKLRARDHTSSKPPGP